MYISYPEPFQQAVVWPSYPQQLQTPHLLMPPMAPLTQQMQPPPLTPIQLLGTDYLGGATLHQVTIERCALKNVFLFKTLSFVAYSNT